MSRRWLIGLASGSSADGIEAALIEADGIGLDLRARTLQMVRQPYSDDMRDLLLAVGSATPCEGKQIALLHRLLGESFAAAARRVADQASFSLQKVQCIGYSGHTVFHDPEGRFPSTLSLGMSAIVAERTGVTTVSDFRARDLAVGGQGVPLAALIDYLLFHDPNEDRVLLHLGGLARLVYLPADGDISQLIGFEVGPCTVLLNALMRQLTGGREGYDPGGKHAVQGRCIEALLERWLGHPYLQRRPPKSLPRQSFGDDFAQQTVQLARQSGWSLHDLLCTATHFVAAGIAGSLKRYLPSPRASTRIFLSGGGVRNGFLWHLLEQKLAGWKLEKTDRLGIAADARKSLAFGLLAALTIDGVPANVPSATGAAGTRLLGNLTPGSSTNWARCLAWMSAQAVVPMEVEM